jgi:hypothetical protein
MQRSIGSPRSNRPLAKEEAPARTPIEIEVLGITTQNPFQLRNCGDTPVNSLNRLVQPAGAT